MEKEREFRCSHCQDWEFLYNLHLYNDLSVCPKCKSFLEDHQKNYFKRMHPLYEELDEKIKNDNSEKIKQTKKKKK